MISCAFRLSPPECATTRTPRRSHSLVSAVSRVQENKLVSTCGTFPGGTARTDFPGGDARTLYRSIQRLLALPDETRIFVGHDYLPKNRSDFRFETTVGEQKASNVHVGGGVTEEAFVAMRQARDATLRAPQLILPSLQVNIRAGALPPPDAKGQRSLVLPLNVLGAT